jgi:hypothetical protein
MRLMRSFRRLISVGIAVAAVSHGVVFAGPPARPVCVGITVDGPAHAAIPRHAPAMIAEADAIWHRYGVTVVLLRAIDGPEAAACDVRLALVFAPSGKQDSRLRPFGPGLGAIWFDDGLTPGQSLTIDRDMVEMKVREAGAAGKPLAQWPPALADVMIGRALGRVLAHEIGHFLLASPTHASSGLMRPAFDGRVLAGWDRSAFRLHRDALRRLQLRLARLDPIDRPTVTAIERTP